MHGIDKKKRERDRNPQNIVELHFPLMITITIKSWTEKKVYRGYNCMQVTSR